MEPDNVDNVQEDNNVEEEPPETLQEARRRRAEVGRARACLEYDPIKRAEQLREINTLAIQRCKKLRDCLVSEQAERLRCVDVAKKLRHDNDSWRAKYRKACEHYGNIKTAYDQSVAKVASLEAEKAQTATVARDLAETQQDLESVNAINEGLKDLVDDMHQ